MVGEFTGLEFITLQILGTPLPIWRTEDGIEEICIGSIEELFAEINKANTALGLNQITNKENLDLHRPYVDDIILVSQSGKQMKREADLIDVWFDSGAMPYAQLHYPFENKELIDKRTTFPADFIAEGVDQTRGWFLLCMLLVQCYLIVLPIKM